MALKVLLSLKSREKPHLRVSCWQNSVSKSRNLCDWREKQSQDFHPVFPRGNYVLCWVRFIERECSLPRVPRIYSPRRGMSTSIQVPLTCAAWEGLLSTLGFLADPRPIRDAAPLPLSRISENGPCSQILP